MHNYRASRSFRDLMPYLVHTIRQADPARDVIVLDIDATVLYNRDSEPIVHAVPNFKVQPLYDLARSRNIPVHFVTARIGTKDNRMFTLKQLRSMGFDWFDSLFMRPVSVPPVTEAIAQYKLDARRTIAAAGRKTIALNIGDQWTDLLVADTPSLALLDLSFPREHVVFKPSAPHDARVAVKLFEVEH